MKKQFDIKKLVLLNLPYLLMGLFATNFGEAWRLAQGANASEKFLSLFAVLPGALQSFWPSLHPLDLLMGLCCGAGLRLAVYLKSKNAKKYRHGLEYGSARWGTREDIAAYIDPVFQNNVILTKTESLTMNSRPKDPKTARNKNVLVIGGSGSGKTRFWLKPNLMQMHSSYVVTDPKGTILVECGKMLQRGAPKLGKDGKPMKDKHGKVIYEPYRIKVLNTINFKKSMHYNPFSYIHSEKDILKLVTTLIANTKGEGKAGDDFWVKAETLLYCALIGYIHYEAPVEEQNFSTLIEFINAMEVREDDEEFDLVQKIRSNVRRYPNGWGKAAPLTGLLYCADCGGKMYVHRTNNGRRISQYTCSNYTKVPCGTLCPTQHRINESAVLTLVSDTLRAIAEYSRNDRTEFIHTVQETQVAQQSADISKKRRRLAAAQKRAGELEKLICKIYEDNALGKLPDARYKALDAQYAKEQDALEIEIAELEKAVTGYEQSQKSAEKFIALIDKYENFDTLTNTMLNEFVEKILVHERARKGSQDTTQEIEIYFNFLGRYIPPSLQPVPLTPEEQEELRKKEERKDRLHQNYLKRKASGAQKRYEDKIKAKKKAEMDAKKALIRTEDMKKGIFSTVGQLPKEEPRKATSAAV